MSTGRATRRDGRYHTDLEPDPSGSGPRIRHGVAQDRRDMRHGRKSKRFNAYARRLAADLDTKLIFAAALTPAHRPEEEASPALRDDLMRCTAGTLASSTSMSLHRQRRRQRDPVAQRRGPLRAIGGAQRHPLSAKPINLRAMSVACTLHDGQLGAGASPMTNSLPSERLGGVIVDEHYRSSPSRPCASRRAAIAARRGAAGG